jgi:hypothetical protein
MKETIIVLACLLSFTAMAQKMPASGVPKSVRENFAKEFPEVKSEKWMKEKDGGYEAAFKQKGVEMSATFNATGSLRETETEIATSNLPSACVKYIQEHYKGSRIKEAARLKLADGSTEYEAEVKGIDVIFDANGSFLRTVKP